MYDEKRVCYSEYKVENRYFLKIYFRFSAIMLISVTAGGGREFSGLTALHIDPQRCGRSSQKKRARETLFYSNLLKRYLLI